jgi:hypothetical protein
VCPETGKLPEGQVRVHSADGRFFGVYAYRSERELFCPVKLFFPE